MMWGYWGCPTFKSPPTIDNTSVEYLTCKAVQESEYEPYIYGHEFM